MTAASVARRWSRRKVPLTAVAAILVCALPSSPSSIGISASMAPRLERIERQVYLMGTLATLMVYEVDRDAGLARLDRMLAVLEQAEAELSTWRDDSEVSALNRHPPGAPFRMSAALCETWPVLGHWWRSTAGAFDPAIGSLIEVWGLRGAGRLPTTDELDRARATAGFDRFAFDEPRCLLTREADVTLDTGAFGKGEALDRVARDDAGRAAPWLIDLGGQVMAHGRPPGAEAWEVGVAHPEARQTSLLRLDLATGSLATSGGSERDRDVTGVRVGHVLDPRRGRPAPFDGAAVVWHEEARAADILSTALYVMGPAAGLAWAEARGVAACFLIPDPDGVRIEPTRAFRRRFPVIDRR